MKFENDFQMKVRDAFAAQHEPEAQHLLATAYWGALLSLFLVIVVASLAYGLWEFLAAPEAEEGAAGVRSQQAAFSRAALQETLDGLDARAALFEERVEAPAAVQDPS